MTGNGDFLHQRFVRSPLYTAAEVADELLLVRIHDETQYLEGVYTLNSVGARVWQLIDGDRRVEQIRDVLAEEFEIRPDAAEEDLIAFLKHLAQVGAIDVA